MVDGPVAAPTSVNGHALFTVPGTGTVDSRLEARAEYGALHARATVGWKHTAAAWVNVAGFVALLFNLFIINLVVSGLHSYAGL